MKKYVELLSILILIFALSGCSNNSDNKTIKELIEQQNKAMDEAWNKNVAPDIDNYEKEFSSIFEEVQKTFETNSENNYDITPTFSEELSEEYIEDDENYNIIDLEKLFDKKNGINDTVYDSNSSKGKLYITKCGIPMYANGFFYLDGYPIDFARDGYGLRLSDIIENTHYSLFLEDNEIDFNSKNIPDLRKIYFLGNGNQPAYLIDVYNHSSKDFPTYKDLGFRFIDEKGGYILCPTKICIKSNKGGENDFYIKETFNISNAPSLDNFKDEFLQKVEGKGKELVKISKLEKNDNYVGYMVTIPYIDRNNCCCSIAYKYNMSRECIEIDWDFNHKITNKE